MKNEHNEGNASVSLTETDMLTGEYLLKATTEKIPMLLGDIIPKQGMFVLAGSSDLGKSYLLMQLCVSIIHGEASFLGFDLAAKHKRVIYVSTEDGRYELGARLAIFRKQTKWSLESTYARFLTPVDPFSELIQKIDRALKKAPVDLIVIDTLADVYQGNMHMANEVRAFLSKFQRLSDRYGTAICFTHHCGKNNETKPPHKDNLLGSMAIESKMRLALELRNDFDDGKYRHLCILKGNHVPLNLKNKSFKILFDYDSGMSNTGERVEVAGLYKKNEFNKKHLYSSEAIQLLQRGNSIRAVEDAFAKRGIKLSSSTIGEIRQEAIKKGVVFTEVQKRKLSSPLINKGTPDRQDKDISNDS